MTIDLNADQQHRIAEALRTGAYDSPSDVIDRALDALRERAAWLAANSQQIDAKIRIGISELERGEAIRENDLDTYLQRLKTQPE